jgi:electron transfer flavoprotein alpha subunit
LFSLTDATSNVIVATNRGFEGEDNFGAVVVLRCAEEADAAIAISRAEMSRQRMPRFSFARSQSVIT